jgi:hypothetical protein
MRMKKYSEFILSKNKLKLENADNFWLTRGADK